MNKRILTPLFLLTCLSFYSCGKKTVKVTLKGDDHLTWEKAEDKAEVSKDYVVKALPDKGYQQYSGDLFITSGSTPLSEPAKQYKFEESSQTLTIYKGNIFGDISIEGKSDEVEYKICYLNTDSYKTITTDYVTITSRKLEKTIEPVDGKTITEEKLKNVQIEPSDVKYTLEKVPDKNKANLTINNTEFYRNITITLPTL